MCIRDSLYTEVGKEFAAHKTVVHGSHGSEGWYVGEDGQNTNAAENFFGNFKRSMKGTYRFCGEQHLQRYLNEFQFRHNYRAKLDVYKRQTRTCSRRAGPWSSIFGRNGAARAG